MNKTERFLASYENDLRFELQQINEDMERIQNQITDLENQIQNIKASIDTSYTVFVASQSSDTEDTEISALYSLIKEKNSLFVSLQEKQMNIQKKIDEIRSLDDRAEAFISFDQKELLSKLQLIYKWMIVDRHRAQEELAILINRLEQ